VCALYSFETRPDNPSEMNPYKFNPLKDPRWVEFVATRGDASVFHTPEWLDALRRTYGYEPIVYTTSPPDAKLQNGVVFCQIRSWLTGSRLVSLPFSDYCEPLFNHPSDLEGILDKMGEDRNGNEPWRYIEIRPTDAHEIRSHLFLSTCDYALHRLDLSPSLSQLLGAFHKDSTQRKIRRAEREGVQYQEGRSESLLLNFYRLLILTRRRLGVPPQPLSWFRNLIDCLGEALQIRVAFKDSLAVAAMITLRYKGTLVYKYGCSDDRFHNLGGVHLLFWRSIQEAKSAGLHTFDFGRSDCDNEGLIRFKDRWGTRRTTLKYLRYTTSAKTPDAYESPAMDWKLRVAKRMLAHTPRQVLSAIGKTFYKHVG
jgi:Acetyltransferase (GNAT) domain